MTHEEELLREQIGHTETKLQLIGMQHSVLDLTSQKLQQKRAALIERLNAIPKQEQQQ